MLFSLIAIVVAAFAVVALIVSQMKTREELASLRGELVRVSAQASDAAQQLKVARESLSQTKKPEALPAAPVAAAPVPAAKEETPAAPVAAPQAAPGPTIKVQGAEELSPEVLMVISAAVAAFLGKTGRRPRVVQTGINPWAQQGRVIVQASHNLGVVR